MNIINRMISDYTKRSKETEFDPELYENPPERMFQKKVPWNISTTVILISGVIALTGFIIYSYTGTPYPDATDMFTNAEHNPKLKMLASVDSSPIQNREVEIGVDERDVMLPDEIIPPGVVSPSMPPMSNRSFAKVIPKSIPDSVIAVKNVNNGEKNRPPKTKNITHVNVMKVVPSETAVEKIKKLPKKKTEKNIVTKNDVNLKKTKTFNNIKERMGKLKPKQRNRMAITSSNKIVSPTTFEKKPIPLGDEQIAEKNYQKAIAYIEKKQSKLALPYLEKALSKQPSHLFARKVLTGILIEDKAWKRAEENLKAALVYNPESKLFPMWLARIYLELNRSVEAVKVLESRERYAKGDGSYYVLMAMAHQRNGSFSKSVDAYKKAIEIDNFQSKWWFGLGTVLEVVENWPDAYSAYNQAINTAQLSEDMNSYAKERLKYVKMQLALLAELSD